MKFGVGLLGTQPVATLVEQARLAESLGYDTVWFPDSHLVFRELYVTLTAAALGTRRIRIASGVTVPHTRHASLTASAMVTLDELAPGRIVLGLGTGDTSLGTLGIAWQKAARTQVLEDTIGTLRPLMRAATARFDGGAEGRIAWLEQPRAIPILVAGSGPKMLEAAGRLGDGVILYASATPSILEAGLRCIEAGARASGRTLEDLEIVVWVPVSIGHDGALARQHVLGRVASALRHPLPVALSDEDTAVVRRIREAYDFFAHGKPGATHAGLIPDRFIDMMAVAGTPAEVRERMRALAALPGIAGIVIGPQAPADGFTTREDILRLFADEVMARGA